MSSLLLQPWTASSPVQKCTPLSVRTLVTVVFIPPSESAVYSTLWRYTLRYAGFARSLPFAFVHSPTLGRSLWLVRRVLSSHHQLANLPSERNEQTRSASAVYGLNARRRPKWPVIAIFFKPSPRTTTVLYHVLAKSKGTHYPIADLLV